MHPNRIKLYAEARVAIPTCYGIQTLTPPDYHGHACILAIPNRWLREQEPRVKSFYVIGLADRHLTDKVREIMVMKLVRKVPAWLLPEV